MLRGLALTGQGQTRSRLTIRRAYTGWREHAVCFPYPFLAETNQVTELFHPRRHEWREHFTWDGIYIVGRTAIGRTTVRVLDMNLDDQLVLRSS